VSAYTPEADVKTKLADAIRMLERAEFIDHSGHCSARRNGQSFYINSGASVRSSLTSDDIVAVDLDGTLLEGTAKPPLELYIHAEVYRARPDVNAVMHMHARWSTVLTMTGVKYQPVYAQGVLLGDIPVMDSPLSVNTKALGETLALTLADRQAVLLKSHGAVVVGTGIVEAFALAVYLEENARRQWMALQIGDPYVFNESERQACRRNLWSQTLFAKAWEYYRAKL
jgi:L-fuculose-phosphate aldolase